MPPFRQTGEALEQFADPPLQPSRVALNESAHAQILEHRQRAPELPSLRDPRDAKLMNLVRPQPV